MNDSKRDDFNWVKARNECSLLLMFRRLEIDATANIAERNGQLQAGQLPFRVIPNGGKQFLVMRGDVDSVAFVLQDREIVAEDAQRRELVRGGVTLSNDGECRLKVKDEEWQRWQFLRKALEAFFFEG